MKALMDYARRMAFRFGQDSDFESAAMLGLAKGLLAKLPQSGVIASIRNALCDELRSKIRRRKLERPLADRPARPQSRLIEKALEAGHEVMVEILVYEEPVSSVMRRTGMNRAQVNAQLEAGIAWARRS